MAITDDLKTAYEAIKAKAAPCTELFDYYDGNQPLTYIANYLADIFAGLRKHFVQNWCAVVIDSALDRLNLRSFETDDEALAKSMADLWHTNELSLESDSVHEAALVAGEAFLIAWTDNDEQPEAYYNDPRLCHVEYDTERPRVKAWAAKQWVQPDGYLRLTLYYPDRLYYFVSSQKADEVSGYEALLPMDPPEAPNPYGVIPVFHFRTHRRITKSDLTNALPLQDAVNKLLTDMMLTAEYGAFPQRWVATQADVGNLKNAPNEIWDLPEGAQTGEFAAADLMNYLQAIDNLATSIGIVTKTPKHYFFRDAGSGVSGEALIAMESPLNKRVSNAIESFIPTWREAMAFMLQLAGQTVADPQIIVPNFDRPESVQPRTSAEITALRVQSGVPLMSALRIEGIDQSELDMIKADKADEQAAKPALSFGTLTPVAATETPVADTGRAAE